MTYLSKLALTVLLIASGLALSATPVQAVTPAGGPIVLMGIDAEDGGAGGHGPTANYVQLVDSVLADVTNANTGGILVLGSDDFSQTSFWNAVAAGVDAGAADGTAGEPVTYVDGVQPITDQSFAGYEILAIAGSIFNTSGGLDDAENDVLSSRKAEIAAFINAGGGLIGFDQGGLTDQFGYLSTVGSFTSTDVSDFFDIDPTADGQAVGVDNNLDVCCWHQIFEEYPNFLSVLAYRGGTQDVVALGGEAVVVPPEDCTNGVDDDNDGLIDLDDPDCQTTPPPPGNGGLSGTKFYDANANGVLDAGEEGIEGWVIDVADGGTHTVMTDADGNWSIDVEDDTYDVTERPGGDGWHQTAPATGTHDDVVVSGASITGLDFGNVCVGDGGGHTRGFWQNKNGQRAFESEAGSLDLLVSLNLRNEDGTHFDPATYGEFRRWIRSARAGENGAYMLSAQLAAMALNVHVGFVDGSAMILAEGSSSDVGTGFASVDDVVAEADAALAADGLTEPGDEPNRTYQLLLSGIIDAANNNESFAQGSQDDCTAPVFPGLNTLFADGTVSCAGADDTSQPAGVATVQGTVGQVDIAVSLQGLEPGIDYNVVVSEHGDCDPVFSDEAGTEITVDGSGNGTAQVTITGLTPGTYEFLVNVVATATPTDPTQREIANAGAAVATVS